MCLLSCARTHLGVILLISSFIKISNTLVSDSTSFTQSQPCEYPLSNGEIIDLSPFINSSQPLTVSTNTSLYIYHPCTDIPLNCVQSGDCSKNYGVCYFSPNIPTGKPVDFNAVCRNDTRGNFSVVALNGEAVFRKNPQQQPELVYKHSNKDTIITTYVQLECDEHLENSKLLIVKTSAQEHVLTLRSRYTCVQAPHYMSGGAVFFIIVIVFFLIYFLGGILVLRFIRGATGVEMIPNHEFWCSLPQLAKDGFKYLTNCGKNTPDSYEKI